jgi:cation diffusion facilitator family transporter
MAGKSDSRRVVLAALAGNVAIAILKFAAFFLTGSTAMLTEGVHSVVDTSDQGLLLLGQARAARRPNARHPFGYGMETYFWSFVVALMVFFAGGSVAVVEGVAKLLHPGPIVRPGLDLAVIAVAALFEVVTFLPAYRAYKTMIGRHRVRLLRFVTISKDPSLFATLLEDVASMIGLGLAAIGVIGAAYLGFGWADAVASIGIGVLLLASAVIMANETRSLIAGEAAAYPVVERARAALKAAGIAGSLESLRTLHLGPDKILVAVSWKFARGLTGAAMDKASRILMKALQDSDPRITEVLFAPAKA